MKTRISSEFLAVVMIVATAFLAVAFDAWRIARPLDDSTYIPQDPVITPEVEILQEYLRIDTSNPPGNEVEAALWLEQKLAEAGIESEVIESGPGRVNVYARLEGRTEGQGLMLTHHMDVVPAKPEEWTEPPFEANIRMNQIYARGALDMKSIGVCHLITFIEIARSGTPLERDLVFLAVADEETGGELGMKWLVRNRPDIFEGVRYALNEGGIAETLQEKVTYFGIEVATRQMVRLRLSSPERRPLELARTALLPMQSPQDPSRVLPEVVEVLHRVAEYRIQGRELLSDVEKVIDDGDFWKLHATYKALFQDTVAADGLKESEDGGYEMKVVIQNLPDRDPDEAIARVRAAVAHTGVDVWVVQKQGPARITSWKTPFFGEIAEAVRNTYGDVAVGPQILQYASNDSRFLRNRGIAAYGMWPFPVNLYQTFGIHSGNERIRLDWFVKGVELTRGLVKGYVVSQVTTDVTQS